MQQLGHDFGPPGICESAPAADLGEGAKAAQAKPAKRIDDTHADAGSGDGGLGRRHLDPCNASPRRPRQAPRAEVERLQDV